MKDSKQIRISLIYHIFEPVDRIRLMWQSGTGDECIQETVWMERQDGDQWLSCCKLPVMKGALNQFYFEVWRGEEMIDTEPRYCHYAETGGELTDIAGRWITNTDNNCCRYTSAFQDCIYSPVTGRQKAIKGKTLMLVQDFICPKGYELCLVGSEPELGAWDVGKAVRMERRGYYAYAAELPAVKGQMEYKYVLRGRDTGDVIWETGCNRILDDTVGPSRDNVRVLEDTALRLSQYQDRLAGIVVPVFSLRSRASWGVGDFGDMKRMVTWANHVGLHALQILPINDTTRTGTWEDSYPYNAISIYALHPMYADVNALGKLKDGKTQRQFEQQRRKLNAMAQVDYEAVNRLKNQYLWTYFVENEQDIEVSFNPVLMPYVYYRVLMDVYGTANFREWPDHRSYDEKRLEKTMRQSNHWRKVRYYAWVQQILVQQLKDVHKYARRKGVILKGDMPIGVSRNSATVWFDPQYFHTDGQAGAPPDFFSEKGQNWGFPTYNWDNILRDNGVWWKNRLVYMAQFFDAYRIDHVLGFFRIWQIPYGTSDGRMGYFLPDLPMTEDEIRRNGFWKPMQECIATGEGDPSDVLFIQDKDVQTLYHPAISGQSTATYHRLSERDSRAYDHIHYEYFYQRHNDFWAKEGMRRLPCAVYSTRMLVCAEDLGMVPDCVHRVLERFRILSLEVQSMPKRNEGTFSWLPNNPYRSVDTITTHDMEPLRLWWKKFPDRAQLYFEQRMSGSGEVPEDLSPDMAEHIIRQHMASPSVLCIVALQDWLAIDGDMRNPDVETEQVNQPANPRHYWRYRMHINIEDMQRATAFNEKVRALSQRKN